MFIEQSITPENKFWKYIVGCVLTFIAAMIGQMPLVIAVLGKSLLDNNKINLDRSESLMKSLDSNMTLFLLLLSSAFAIFGLYISVRFIHRTAICKIAYDTAKTRLAAGFLFVFHLGFLFDSINRRYAMLTNPEDYVMNFKAGSVPDVARNFNHYDSDTNEQRRTDISRISHAGHSAAWRATNGFR